MVLSFFPSLIAVRVTALTIVFGKGPSGRRCLGGFQNDMGGNLIFC